MKKITSIAFLVFLICSHAKSVNRYVSATGNDANNGTSTATPWQTITKVNANFSAFSAGDSILFKRGDEFFGTITINKSGTSSARIIIGAYGSGARPVITEFVNLTGWTSVGTNIWESSAVTNGLSTARVFVIGTVLQRYARFPNTGYLTLDSYIQTNNAPVSITDAGFSTTAVTDLDLGEIVIRTRQWTLDHVPITSHSGNTINFYTGATTGQSSTLTYTPINGWGYFVQNYPSAVDVAGEFYYSPTTKKIRTYSVGAPVAARVAVKDYAIYGSGVDYITVDNLSFQGAHGNIVEFINGSDHITLQNCDVGYGGFDGVRISGTFASIQTCSILNVLNRAVQTTGANVSNNTIYNSGHIGGMNENGSGKVSLNNQGANCITEYNNVKNTGYAGIKHGFANSRTRYNIVDSFCLNRNDAGGIYVQNGSDAPISNSRITKNICKNGGDSRPGTGTSGNSVFGIYLDDRMHDVLVDSNVCINSNKGIFIHGSRDITILDNLCYNNDYAQLQFSNNVSSGLPLTGMVVLRNKLIGRLASQMIEQWNRKSTDPIASFGTVNFNWYTRPIQESGGIAGSAPIVQITQSSNSTTNYANLALWKAANGGIYDGSTNKYANSPIANVNLFLYIVNETKVDKVITLVDNYVDVTNLPFSGSVILTPFTAKVLITTSTNTRITPTITWNNPAAITYETLLSATQLNATSGGVPGTHNYTPGLNTLLNAGTHSLRDDFTPSDPAAYNSVSKTVTIVVNKAAATLAYTSDLTTKIYNGLPQAPTVLTNPLGLTVVSTLFNGLGTTPINSGSYPVISGLSHVNYNASSISGTFIINKAPATITVTSNLNQFADGNPKPVSAITNPLGLPLTITYNLSGTAPSAPGTYEVIINVVHANYTGADTVTLVISSSAADIFITNLLQVYDGTSKNVTVTSPYTYTLIYNPATHVNAGSYQAIATINDGIHFGADTQTLVITKDNGVLTWTQPERIFVGTALSATQLNATSSIPGIFNYSFPEGTILPAGTHLITGTFVPTDLANYNISTISTSVSVYGNIRDFLEGNWIFLNQ